MSNFADTCLSKMGSGLLCYETCIAAEHIYSKIFLRGLTKRRRHFKDFLRQWTKLDIWFERYDINHKNSWINMFTERYPKLNIFFKRLPLGKLLILIFFLFCGKHGNSSQFSLAVNWSCSVKARGSQAIYNS